MTHGIPALNIKTNTEYTLI